MFPSKIGRSGYRTITVAGQRYRWVAGGVGDYPTLSLMVRQFTGGGTALNVDFTGLLAPSTFPYSDYTLGSQHYKTENGLHYRRVGVVLPSHVARAIAEALAKGWRPEEKGKPFQLAVSHEKYQMPFHWESTYDLK